MDCYIFSNLEAVPVFFHDISGLSTDSAGGKRLCIQTTNPSSVAPSTSRQSQLPSMGSENPTASTTESDGEFSSDSFCEEVEEGGIECLLAEKHDQGMH